MKFDCILLAAGLSSRMKEWKLRLPFQDKTIIESALDNACIYTEKTIISGGNHLNELKELINEGNSIRIIENPDFARGMMTSIKAALPYVTTEKFFITLGDMPLIPADIYREMSLIDFEHVLFPVFNGRRGHPVLLDLSLKNSIMKFPDTGRMKDFLNNYHISEFKTMSEGIVIDIDTLTDYRKLLDR